MYSDTPKPWSPGDPRVEPYMVEVSEALDRIFPFDHRGVNRERTEIYNRCYGAVWKAILDAEKQFNSRNVTNRTEENDDER